MPDDIKNVSSSWSSTTLTQAEIWQVLTGKVRISFDVSPTDENGILLEPLMGIEIANGTTVRYRKAGTSYASISRVKSV